MHNKVLVFDIETVPDEAVVSNLMDVESDNVEELRNQLVEYHLQITDGKNSFPRQLFHKVVAISFLEAGINRDGMFESYNFIDLRSGGRGGKHNKILDEKDLVKGFFHYIEENKPRLVSFNGRTFDLPVLKYRAMKYGIAVPFLYNSGDKWNNYMQRYSTDWHCDLLEVLSDFGGSARIKMNEVCAILDIPGKLGVDGSQVTSLYDEGKVEEIMDYCETDVLNTYIVYLRYMQHRGNLTTVMYNKAIEDIESFIKEKDMLHLNEYLEEWYKINDGKITIL